MLYEITSSIGLLFIMLILYNREKLIMKFLNMVLSLYDSSEPIAQKYIKVDNINTKYDVFMELYDPRYNFLCIDVPPKTKPLDLTIDYDLDKLEYYSNYDYLKKKCLKGNLKFNTLYHRNTTLHFMIPKDWHIEYEQLDDQLICTLTMKYLNTNPMEK